jgi:hypothetical protein
MKSLLGGAVQDRDARHGNPKGRRGQDRRAPSAVGVFDCGRRARFANAPDMGPRVRPALLRLLVLSVVAAVGCSKPVPTPLEFEPVCVDYKGKDGREMLGGLRVPVVLTIHQGTTEVQRATLFGLPSQKAPGTQILLPDADAEYTVAFAQCANQRPERPRKDGPDPAWQCGEARVYKTDKLVTRKGDLSTHKLAYAWPPDATCWIGDVALREPPPP